MIRRSLLSLLIVFLALAAVNAWDDPSLGRFEFSEPHMGTTFRIVLYAPDKTAATSAAKAAFARIAELDRIMSDYKADSELMQLCKKAGGPPVEVTIDLFNVLKKAEEISKLSEGTFDVSIGPVVKLWRKARRTGKLPNEQQLKKALALVDYRKIRLSAEGRRVELQLIGMLLDLGGIAKGYAADAALAILRSQGITRALVAAGGDIAVSDPPPDAGGWKVGIAPLDPKAEPAIFLKLKNAAVSTSGDLHQYVEIDGQRYSHIVDPKTGLGLTGRRSVSVIATEGITADALDTACCVLGSERGLKIIEKQAMAALFIVETDGKETATPSSRWEQYLWKDTN
jgi:thiamine biosynthesis lipoprotein